MKNKTAINILLFVLLGLFNPLKVNCQVDVILNGAYIVFSNGVQATPIYMVVGNSATTAIQNKKTPTPDSLLGGMITESEFNQVLWNIGTNTGTYTLPFCNSMNHGLYYIPLKYVITTAGVLNGAHTGGIAFSTWGGEAFEGIPNEYSNILYKPAEVANMDNLNSGSDDSPYVVDRFWVIDGMNYTNPNYYSTLPAATISFLYTDGGKYTETGTNNTLIETNLEAQRWNTTLGTWGDWQGTATITTGGPQHVGTASAVGVTSANMFRAWTLVDKTKPLPVELVSFTAECQNYSAVLQWGTASENNNNFFTIDRTQDGVSFQTVAIVKGAGSSSQSHAYSAIDDSPLAGISYYRISQTDMDGKVTHMQSVVFQPCENNEVLNAYAIDNIVNVHLNTAASRMYTISLMSVTGQTVFSETKTTTPGMNEYRFNPNVAHGIYILQIIGKEKVYCKKLYLGNL